MVHSRSPSQLTPDASPCAFSATLTTTTLDRSSLRWFGTSPCRAIPEGPPPSPTRHRNSQRDLLHRNLQSRSWHTVAGAPDSGLTSAPFGGSLPSAFARRRRI